MRLHARESRGQALAETLVALLALSVLFVLIPLLGKYQDVAHQSMMASRYVAWQATVRNDSDGGSFEDAQQTAVDVKQKFFSNSRAVIVTQQAPAGTPKDRIALWEDHAGRAIITDDDAIRVGYGDGLSSNAIDGFLAEGGTGALRPPLIALSPGDYRLRNRGLLRGEVEVRIANLPDEWLRPFNALNLSIRRQTTVMPDSWAAKNADSVESRVSNSALVFPTGQLRPLAQLVQLPLLVLEDGKMKAPKLGELGFWSDVVPEDRLK